MGPATEPTSALWLLYVGVVAVHSRRLMREGDNSFALARDGDTYLHIPIVAGVILTAVGTDFRTRSPGSRLSTVPSW